MTDPVVAAAWRHCRAIGPGEHINLTRFSIYPEHYQRPSPVLALDQWRAWPTPTATPASPTACSSTATSRGSTP